MKRLITLLAVLGMVLALAPTAQATPPVASYQYVFVTSGTYSEASSDIADYNDFVQAAADAGSLTSGLNLEWTAIVSTSGGGIANVNALVSGPVYGLDDTKVADNYADMWDGSLDAGIQIDENGDDVGGNVAVYTGSLSTGVGDNAENDYRLGTTFPEVRIGRTGNTTGGWIQSQAWSNPALQFYALSELVSPPAGTVFIIM